MAKACSTCIGVGAAVKEASGDVTIVQRKKNLGLLAASYVGHKDCVKFFIKEGADVNCIDDQFDSDCRENICDRLGIKLESDLVNPVLRNDDWCTPLMYAARNGHLEIVKILVRTGADVNLVKSRPSALGTPSMTALATAATEGRYKCVEYLIEAGANVNSTDPSAMLCAACARNTVNARKTVDILIKAGADVNRSGLMIHGKSTPLVEVARFGTPRILSLLIEAGADVNFGPLVAAARNGNATSVKLLVEAGANVNQQNEDGETPLHVSLMGLGEKVPWTLMELGADVNIADNIGVTPLISAARIHFHLRDFPFLFTRKQIKNEEAGCIKRVSSLLKAGAEIGRRDYLSRNSLEASFQQFQKNVQDFQMLLYAAGETVDRTLVPTDDYSNNPILSYSRVINIFVPEYFTELKENLDLKHLCREAIRKQLLDLNPHQHLFGRIPRLGLPSLIIEYLLYNCSLD